MIPSIVMDILDGSDIEDLNRLYKWLSEKNHFKEFKKMLEDSDTFYWDEAKEMWDEYPEIGNGPEIESEELPF